MEQVQVLQLIGTFLLGGLSVGLFNYVKFNGRQIRTETRLDSHLVQEQIWQEKVEKGLGRMDRRLDTIILHMGVDETES